MCGMFVTLSGTVLNSLKRAVWEIVGAEELGCEIARLSASQFSGSCASEFGACPRVEVICYEGSRAGW